MPAVGAAGIIFIFTIPALTAQKSRSRSRRRTVFFRSTLPMATQLGPSGAGSPKENPFYYNSPIGAYERIKLILMSLALVPLVRIILITLCFFCMWICALIATLGWSPLEPQPLPRARRIFILPMRLLCRCVLFIFGVHWVSVEGQPGRAPIIVCNHVSVRLHSSQLSFPPCTVAWAL